MTQVIDRFLAYFQDASLRGFGIALLMALAWALLYGLHKSRDVFVWLMLPAGLLSGLLLVPLVQTPVNVIFNELLKSFLSADQAGRILLVSILAVLVAGLLQEGAKLLPLLILKISSSRQIDAKFGLLAGAAAGIGFGFLEAQWMINALLAAGWQLNMLAQSAGLPMLLTLWERLSMLGIHAGLGALAGYGLGKGKGRGWRYYLLATLLHALMRLCLYLLASGVLSLVLAEVLLTVMVAVLAVVMLSVRWESQ